MRRGLCDTRSQCVEATCEGSLAFEEEGVETTSSTCRFRGDKHVEISSRPIADMLNKGDLGLKKVAIAAASIAVYKSRRRNLGDPRTRRKDEKGS